MNRVRPFAGLIFLAFLGANASPRALPGSGGVPRVQVAQVRAPHGPDLELLNLTTPLKGTPIPVKPVDDALQDAASESFKDMSGGPTGTILIGAALVAAAALLLAVAIRW
jgi:hypothetical protein